MVKIAFSSPFSAKEPAKDACSLVPDKDPEVATSGPDTHSTGRCLLTLLGLAFILAGLIVGGACIYKFFMPRHKTFEGQLSYIDHTDLDEEPYYLPVTEEADIREEDNVALINIPVPTFAEWDSASIVHDFDRVNYGGGGCVGFRGMRILHRNMFGASLCLLLLFIGVLMSFLPPPQLLTAYLDLQLLKCYIINLNTSIVLPPRSLMDLFMNLATRSYLPQTYLVREELVVTEKIEDVSELGFFIYEHCVGQETYRLQRRDQIIGVQKRSAENCKQIAHFENKFVTMTRICHQ